ncbi:MAG: 5-oxoprolinase subunit PxpB [Deltaproteobacteria bacterium]|nr:5-oxoprolinase subunit PxpB [Deltaproteobacteria bacterium]
MLYEKPEYRVMGDRSLLVELGNEIHLSVHERVRRLFLAIKQTSLNTLLDVVPGYSSLLLVFDPLTTTPDQIRKTINELFLELDRIELPEPANIEIPVVYGGQYGPDLAWVASYHKTTPENVIERHTQTGYRVYMIGFIPGFPYMGELPENLATPRKKTPRTAVPKGSVGLAQRQTGVYPTRSPGGWQIIGRTPLKLFDPLKNPPSLLEMGDRVRFFKISEEEMSHWQR